MRSHFSTPFVRLLTVIINISIILPALSFGFSPTTASYYEPSYINWSDPMSIKLRDFQISYWQKLGILKDQVENQQSSENQKNEAEKSKEINQGNLKENLLENEPKSSETESPKIENEEPIPTVSSSIKTNSKVPKGSRYSAVKNLPNAEKLRQTTAQMPEIPAPIPSTACLISTINCPSNKNFEAEKSPETKFDSLLNSIGTASSTNSLFENLFAFNSNIPVSNSPSLPALDKDLAVNSGNLQKSDFFSNLTLYDPSVSSSYTTATSPLLLPPGGNGVIFDFDGDGKADMGVWRPDNGAWYILRSSDSSLAVETNFGLGSSGDRIVPANYDGDSKTDYAYWRPSTGVWTIKQSSNSQVVTYTLGQSGDIPVQGDYDGDGKSDGAIFRPSNGTWYYRKSSDATTQSYSWGLSTDVPVVGDFDGDGKTDFTVIRPSNANWYIMQSSNGWFQMQWGLVGDRLVPGDYDGDGKTDLGVWRASDNTWYIRKSTTGAMQAYTWGISADYPVPADYDGDGKTDFAIWRTTSGDWWIVKSNNGTQYSSNLGLSTDIPIPVSYVGYFSSSNQTPTAEAGGPYSAATNTAIRFDGRSSTDSDGQIYGYNWNFGDGTTGTGPRPSHVYTTTGNFTVSLTVTDNQGAVSTADTATVTLIDATNARLDPFNAVGGTNIVSKNFSWGTGLAGLPGRAGMGAGISLSYNSLVWLKQTNGSTNYMIFDPDNGFPGPGFRLGMPIIERSQVNPQTGKATFIMVTESGSRVEFRQIGTSYIYETADSSYTQLLNYGNNLTVRTTDGTSYAYQLIGNEFQCVRVTDSNGNFIEATYNSFNRLAQIKDTLGRFLVVNYDENGNPISIVQSHSGGQRVYATFGYETKTINTNFSSATVVGPSNGTSVTVLKQVAFDDGSYYRFTYNDYGQVYQIDTYAADSHKLNHVKYNLESPGAQIDCPRFTEREDYAENWMTVTTQYLAPVSSSWTMPDTTQSESGLMSKMVAPDGTENRYYYHNTGWDKGIPILVETHGADKPGDSIELQRWSTNHLTQNNTSVSYIDNPRPTASAVGDSGSVRKNSVSYTTVTIPSGTNVYLPNDVIEYNSVGSVYRHSQTDYELDSNYLWYHIVGLVKETRLYEGAGTSNLKAKTTYGYDEQSLTNLPNIIQHDTTNYGTSFQFRGNLTSTKRWDVINTSESTVDLAGYNIAGTLSWTQDPVQDTTHRVQISYTDNFSDSTNRNTYAYPTTVTDPDGYTATSKFHFLTGLNDEIQGAKAGQTNNSVRGAIQKTHYDAIDRVQKTEMLYANGTATGAYTRYEYPVSQIEFVSYTKLDNSLAESFSLTTKDGYSRVRAIAYELPNSSGGFSGRLYLYDNMGRNWKSSLPTETSASGNSSSWNATGDDDPNNSTNPGFGWLYTTETFDWKGRSLVMTNTDGTTKENLYEGCGCAGGQIIVTRDEVGRRGKIFYDNYGRINKSQVLYIQPKTETINGIGDPYSTTVNNYNVRDQVETSTIYNGSETSGWGNQVSILEYDGYGRTYKTHVPEQQNSDGSPAYTTSLYYSDDKLQSTIDARGTSTNFTYTYRKKLQQVSYTTVSGVLGVGSTTFQYDAIGNRTSMNDERGNVTYGFNELSRLTSESRYFNTINQTYTRNYSYNDSGLLTSIEDPGTSSLNVTYNYDSVGRLTQVNGGGYGNLPQNQPIASNYEYRAFGGIKNMSYGNLLNSGWEYNNRLQASSYELKNTGNQILMGKNYDYGTTNDDLVKASTDLNDSKLNRSYSYDHLKKLSSAKAGNIITTSGPALGKTDGPFEQSYGRSVFGNFLYMSERIWTSSQWCSNCPQSNSYSESTLNNRNTQTGWNYDPDGRLTRSEVAGVVTNYSYDAAGHNRLVDTPTIDIWRDYDGEGREVRELENNQTKNYFLYSSVLGAVIMDLDSSGNMQRSYVYSPYGQRLAKQENYQVTWLQGDITGESTRETNSSGIVTSKVETDPLGNITQESAIYNYSGSSSYNSNPTGYYGQNSPMNLGYCASSYGVPMPCSVVNMLGLQPPTILQILANHPWSLGNMWTDTANNRQNDPNTTPEERLMWERIRESENFWRNLANGFIELPEYTRISERIVQTGTYRSNLPVNTTNSNANIETCLKEAKLSPSYKDALLNTFTFSVSAGIYNYSRDAMTALDLLLAASSIEGVSPQLLAVVWEGETAIGQFKGINFNDSDDPTAWDVGPFQLNTAQIGYEVSTRKLYNLKGIDPTVDNPYIPSEFAGSFVYGTLQRTFNGDAYSNARLAARKLSHNGGSKDRNRVKAYVGNINWENGRKDHFDRMYPKFKIFFECLAR